jgi:hypothetical protein
MILKYKMGYQLSWAIWAVAIYIITIILVFYPLINYNIINHQEGSFVYRLWFLVIFQFAISMRFKEDFDFLLTLSNTRQNIFKSLVAVSVIFSAIFSSLIVLEQLIIDHLNSAFRFHNIVDPFHFLSPYSTDNIFMQFVFFFMLTVFCSLFGLLIGSLIYRLGKKFTVTFWLLFSSIPVLFFPLLLWIFYLQGQLNKSLIAIDVFLNNFNLISASGILLIVTIILAMAAYLNISRLSQK